MKLKPPKFTAPSLEGARPKFGIGIVFGALLVLGSRLSGSDSAFAIVIGGGVGMALGLIGRSVPERLEDAASGTEELEDSRR